MTHDPVLFRLLPLVAWMLAVSIAVARGEDCKPPNVARVVIDQSRTNAVFCGSLFVLVCPEDGKCHYEGHATTCDAQEVTKVICLTPEQHEAALAAERKQ